MVDERDLRRRTGLPATLRSGLTDRAARSDWPTHASYPRAAKLLLEIHRHLRGQADSLARASELAADPPGNEPLWAAVARAVGQLVDLTAAHHGIEDAYLYPALLRVRPGLTDPIALLADDHRALDVAFEEMERAVDDRAAARLRDATAVLARLLGRHLEDEEEIVVPVLLATGLAFS